MKTLTHIAIDGLRNHRRTELDVPKLLAIAGENGAGKTTVITAINIGVLGYEPTLGKRLTDTRQLLPDDYDRANIALSFADGFAIHRTVGRSMETRVLPPHGERTEREAQTRIDAETGAFVLCFDLGAFLDLSAEKRRAWLLSALPRSAVDLDETVWRRWLGFEEADDFVRRAIDHLWQKQVLADQSILDGLASAIEYTREQANAAEQRRRDQLPIVEEADARAIDAAETPSPDPAELDRMQADLAVAERRTGELQSHIREAEEAARLHRQRAHNLRVVELHRSNAAESLHVAEAAHAAATTKADPEIEKADAKVAQLSERREKGDSPRALAAEMKVTDEWLQSGQSRASDHREEVANAGSAAATARGMLEDARRRLAQLEAQEACPVCGGIETLASARARLAAEAGESAEIAVHAEEDFRAVMEAQQQLDAEVQRRGAEVRALRFRHEAAVALEQELEDAKREAATVRDARDQRVRRLLEDIQQAQTALRASDAELGRLEGIELPPVHDATAAEQELETLGRRTAELRDAIVELQRQARAAGAAEERRDIADRARHELERREERASRLKALLVAQQKLRGHVIQQLVGPVERTAAEILALIDGGKTFRFVFEREGRDVFDFGFEEGGVFRSFRAASTGEAAFLAVVFVAALVAAVQPRWPVLLVDNVERVDDVRRRWLMIALQRVQERFGNVVLSGCCDFPEIEDWTKVDMVQVTDAAAVAA